MRNRKTNQDTDAHREEIRKRIREKREKAKRSAKIAENKKQSRLAGKTKKKLSKAEQKPAEKPAFLWTLGNKFFKIHHVILVTILCVGIITAFLVVKNLEDNSSGLANAGRETDQTMEEATVSDHMEKDDYILFTAELTSPITETISGKQGGEATYTFDNPAFTYPEDPEDATGEISRFFAGIKEDFAGTAKAYADAADEKEKITLKRQHKICFAKENGKIISILQTNTITDKEGTHTYYLAYNFDQESGRLLTLADAFADVDATLEAAKSFLIQTMEEEKNQSIRMGDYKRSCGDVLTDSTWYLGADGIHILCNESVTTKAGSGLIDVVFPKGVELLNAEYR